MEQTILRPDSGYRRVLVARNGNVVGVIDEPELPGGVPEDRRAELWVVKIGFVDEQLGRSAPFPGKEFVCVVEHLRNYLRTEGLMD